jgi:probable O-glycosylation ligase (exosortase A-associated)
MLRTLFVLGIIAAGSYLSLHSAFNALLFYLWYAYFRPEQWIWTDLLMDSYISWVIGIYVIGRAAFSERFRFDLRVALLLLFLAQTLLSTLSSSQGDYAWPYWKDFLKSTVMTYFIAVMATDTARFRLVLLTIGLSLGLEATKQGWSQLVLNPGGQNHNPVPMLGDNNGTAVGMLMLVPILTALAATAGARWQTGLFRFMAFGVLYRAVSTYSRGGFLASLGLGLAYLVRSHKRVPALVAIVLAVALIAPALPAAFWERMSTINDTQEDPGSADASIRGRLHFWRVAVSMANDRPFTGVGHNAFNAHYDAYDDSGGEFGTARSVHSSWFAVLAEQGYMGLALYVAVFLLALRSCARARGAGRLGPEHADLKQFGFAIESGLIAFIIGGSFVTLQYAELFWHVIGLSMALDVLSKKALATARNEPRAEVPSADHWALSATSHAPRVIAPSLGSHGVRRIASH